MWAPKIVGGGLSLWEIDTAIFADIALSSSAIATQRTAGIYKKESYVQISSDRTFARNNKVLL